MRAIFVTIILVWFSQAFSQVQEEWVARYNGPPGDRFDIVTEMILDSGFVYIFGNSVGVNSLNDFIALKYSSAGDLVWEFRYNGPTNSTDDSKSAAKTPDGGFVMTGFTSTSSFNFKIVTIKINNNGDSLWTRIYENPLYERSSGEKVVVDESGNIYVAGSVRAASGFQDIVLLKYSPTGELIAETFFSGAGNRDDLIVSLLMNSNSELYITGTTQVTQQRFDILLLKYSSNLSLLWEKTYNNPLDKYDGATASTLDNFGNIIVTGRTTPENNFSDVIVLKYSPSSDLLWSQAYNGSGNNIDIPFDITTDATGNIILTGYTRSGSVLGSEDILTLKYDAAGNLLWERTFNGQSNGSDAGYCITTDAKGNIYIGGAMDKAQFSLIYITMKYSPNGDLKWYINYNHLEHPEDFIYFIGVDKDDAVYVSGISFGGTTDYDIATIKYSQSVGVVQISDLLPSSFKLYQNFPNPFNPVTRLKFSIRQSGDLEIFVTDINGRLIRSFNNRIFDPGYYELELDFTGESSGVYFITLKLADEIQTIKSILNK